MLMTMMLRLQSSSLIETIDSGITWQSCDHDGDACYDQEQDNDDAYITYSQEEVIVWLGMYQVKSDQGTGVRQWFCFYW